MKLHSIASNGALLLAISQLTAPGQALNEPVIIGRGRDFQDWRHVVQKVLPDGSVRLVTNEFRQIGTGLHYPKDGAWHETKSQFELFAGGAIAREGLFQVIISPDAAQESLLDVLTPDGKRLRASPRWLAYYDRTTGQAEIIAAVKSCPGQLVAPNTIVFPDAFDDIVAAIRYTYQPWGIEQEVVLLDSAPLNPNLWGFNNPNGDVVLEMWSEFHEWPQPDQVITSDIAGRPDVTLDFGEARISTGKAFLLGDEENAVPIAKTWVPVGQDPKQFLIEAVRQSDLVPLLAQIPGQAQVRPVGPKRIGNLAQGRRAISGRAQLLAQGSERLRLRERRTQTASIQSARSELSIGISIDFSVITTTSGLTLESSKTYLVTNSVTLSGTNTIEGGVTVKFTNVTNPTTARLIFTGPIVCSTGPYLPAVFTGIDDDSVGEVITGSIGVPGTNRYALRAIEFGSAAQSYDLHDLRIRYADKAFGLSAVSAINYTVRHSQISDCNIGFNNIQVGTVCQLRNVLVHDTRTGIAMQTTATNTLEHVTMHRVIAFRGSSSGIVRATNCLLISVTNELSFQGTNAVVANLDDTGIFTSVAGGQRYLAPRSAYRNCGVVGIDASLAVDRKKKTTYAPIVLTNAIGFDTHLVPQAQRDVDTPDIGFAYDPIDYLVGGCLTTNATLTLSNGVAVGVLPNASGIFLGAGSKLLSCGAPDNMNRIFPYYHVQETRTNYASGVFALVELYTTSTNFPEIDLRFTSFPMGLGSPELIAFGPYNPVTRLSIRDCQVLGGTLSFGPYGGATNWMGLTNNLIDSASWWVDQGFDGSSTSISLHMRNNLFYRGALSLLHDNPALGAWYVHDNFFCTNTLTVSASNRITNSHNGYFNAAPLPNTWGSNKTNTSAGFETARIGQFWTGRFYYPTNGAGGTLTDLVNAGSRYPTNAGLHAFTTATNQTKEASLVDIGFHYAAVQSSGQALDYDADNIWDYLEDANGNGTYDSSAGETDWQVYTSLLGIGAGPGMVVFTPLK